MQKRNFVLRTIRNGQVKINGRIFRPDNLWVAYDGRLDGMRYAWATWNTTAYQQVVDERRRCIEEAMKPKEKQLGAPDGQGASWANWAELSVWDSDRYIVWEGEINGKWKSGEFEMQYTLSEQMEMLEYHFRVTRYWASACTAAIIWTVSSKSLVVGFPPTTQIRPPFDFCPEMQYNMGV